jgi:predicted phage terminase large subunit-like protein
VRLSYADLDVVGFLDPASGKRSAELKKVAARSAIVVIGEDALQRVFVLYAWAERCPTHRIVERTLDVCRTYPLRVFGIEANAQQGLFGDLVIRDAKREGVTVPIVPVEQPTTVQKPFRIREAVGPRVAAGQLFLMAQQHEMRSELTSFPIGRVVDLIDALASCIRLLRARPKPLVVNDEVEALASYLRRSGVPPAEIERRVGERRVALGEPIAGRPRPVA